MPIVRILLALACLIALPVSAEAPGISPYSFAGRLLATHNAERTRLGIAPLKWSPVLAQQASEWADTLAARGVFEHSKDRSGAGENLWMGTSGAYSPEQMIDAFVREGAYFRPGKFPDVSSTGKWQDVGHYTQLIWPATQEVGCALARGNGKDVLVCRYYPAGNFMGQQVP
ncbi:CAP domain-containing protein [Novosphingobium sp.]|uniref:CAP domain-containing protein n=1 Tax=Novosphingobium sp. TaxID=1874826 RepID=UPI0035B3C163